MYEYLTTDEELERRMIRGRVLQTLEFNKIRDKVTSKARTAYGKKLCADMAPCTDYGYVEENLAWTGEAMAHIMRFGCLPLGGFRDLTEAISYAEAGGTLSCAQLLSVASFLRSAAGIRDALSKARSAGSPFVDETEPHIVKAIEETGTDDRLLKAIDEAILGDNEVSDRASRTLAEIRREKKSTASGIRSLLERVIENGGDMLQESIITIRESRYCIPVKADFKGRIEGIVHGASSTGQTLFVEPMSVVEANNKISELNAQEEAEILRILGEFTADFISEKEIFVNDIDIVAKLDYAFAKGEYGIETESSCARLNSSGLISLRKARHPLIDKDKVVPVDISIGEKYNTLVVTGPNTGGKTVSLKTCGLLALMTMSGLAVPAGDGSEVCVYDRVLADIGDEQSIEQSLSTFSAHVSNIVFILKNIRGRSLVLLDELGSGTDPAEGAALAVAIIDELRSKNCITMATTHYKELKSYAVETEGVMNASCEFDTETLAPTYRLIIGRPGSSNAFVISKRLGLPERVLNSAKDNLSTEEIAYETLLAKAEQDAKAAADALKENEKLKIELTAATKALEEEKAALKQSKTRILNESRSEQKKLLEEREEEIDNMLREFRKKSEKMDRQEALAEMEKIRRRLRAGIKDLEDDSEDENNPEAVQSGEPVKDVVAGELYYVPSFNVTGTAQSGVSKSGRVTIRAGAMSYTVKMSDLRVPTREQRGAFEGGKKNVLKKKGPSNMAKARFEASSRTKAELMLIGMTTAEAESTLIRYLENCSMSGIKDIRIVHGKGTGALRMCVQDVLTRDDRVESFRAGEQGEGDAGVTIAKLR
ncbi:MAG: endonuclease MutS2 [Clostridiales bacterium]|nr:endonuclease MutS2 [Clostridiales bacterium]